MFHSTANKQMAHMSLTRLRLMMTTTTNLSPLINKKEKKEITWDTSQKRKTLKEKTEKKRDPDLVVVVLV